MAISREALEGSCEDFCEFPRDNEDIAESIDDCRGAARPISTRCGGAVAAMGSRESVGEPLEGSEVRTGSETLREVPFVLYWGLSYLQNRHKR